MSEGTPNNCRVIIIERCHKTLKLGTKKFKSKVICSIFPRIFDPLALLFWVHLHYLPLILS